LATKSFDEHIARNGIHPEVLARFRALTRANSGGIRRCGVITRVVAARSWSAFIPK